jgi:hypothetical protein
VQSSSLKSGLLGPPNDLLDLDITKERVREVCARDIGQAMGVGTGIDVSETAIGEVGVTQISVTQITAGKIHASQRCPPQVSTSQIAHLERAPIQGRVAKVGSDK